VKALHSLTRWLGYFSGAFILVLMLLITADVCGRYFFNHPIPGTTELARYLMIFIVFPALAWTAMEDKHVKIDFIMGRFPGRTQTITIIIMLFLTLVVYVVIFWQNIFYSSDVRGVVSALNFPQSPFYWVMTAGWFVFCLTILALLIKSIAGVVKK